MPRAAGTPGAALGAVAAVLLALGAAPAARAELEVCPTCALRSVRTAIERAAPGERIVVRAGRYREGNLVVDKPLELVGDGEAILDGGGEVEVLTVRANDVSVRGLVIENSGMSYTTDLAAIRVEDARNCVLKGNRVRNAFFGIYLAQVVTCVVEDNEVVGQAVSETSSGNAIHLWKADYVRVVNNHVAGHRDGIYLEFTRSGVIEGNVSEHNLRYGLHFMFSERNTYTRNTFRANGAGVAVMYSKHVTMRENHFVDNWGAAAYGLLLKEMSDSEVLGNMFARNTVGLYAEGANRIAVDRNVFVRNGWAIRVMADSMGVVFAHNRFVGNTFEVATNGTRSYNSFLENFWSDYDGYDLDRDGVGDVPHRPVRLFALLVERYPVALVLLRSPLLEFLDLAERVMPMLTPRVMADHRPLMRSRL